MRELAGGWSIVGRALSLSTRINNNTAAARTLEPEILGTDSWVYTGAIYVDPPYLLSRLLPHKIRILENVLENRLSLFSRTFSRESLMSILTEHLNTEGRVIGVQFNINCLMSSNESD